VERVLLVAAFVERAGEREAKLRGQIEQLPVLGQRAPSRRGDVRVPLLQ